MHALQQLASPNATPPLLQAVIDGVLQGAKDKIPNVRAAAVCALGSLISTVDDTAAVPIRNCLLELQRDVDSDVKYNAQLATDTDR